MGVINGLRESGEYWTLRSPVVFYRTHGVEKNTRCFSLRMVMQLNIRVICVTAGVILTCYSSDTLQPRRFKTTPSPKILFQYTNMCVVGAQS